MSNASAQRIAEKRLSNELPKTTGAAPDNVPPLDAGSETLGFSAGFAAATWGVSACFDAGAAAEIGAGLAAASAGFGVSAGLAGAGLGFVAVVEAVVSEPPIPTFWASLLKKPRLSVAEAWATRVAGVALTATTGSSLAGASAAVAFGGLTCGEIVPGAQVGGGLDA